MPPIIPTILALPCSPAVLMGPVKAVTYLLMYGVLSLTLGGCWAARLPWALSIPLAAAARRDGRAGWLGSGGVGQGVQGVRRAVGCGAAAATGDQHKMGRSSRPELIVAVPDRKLLLRAPGWRATLATLRWPHG